MASSPRIFTKTFNSRRQTPELRRNALSLFIVPPRAQASRRCETQATLSGKPPALLAFRSLDPFRALREPDRRRRDEERLSRSEGVVLKRAQLFLGVVAFASSGDCVIFRVKASA